MAFHLFDLVRPCHEQSTVASKVALQRPQGEALNCHGGSSSSAENRSDGDRLWLNVNKKWQRRHVYIDAQGNRVPWIVANPYDSAPVGLGCIVCHRAVAAGLICSSRFATFTVAHRNLQNETLRRHANMSHPPDILPS